MSTGFSNAYNSGNYGGGYPWTASVAAAQAQNPWGVGNYMYRSAQDPDYQKQQLINQQAKYATDLQNQRFYDALGFAKSIVGNGGIFNQIPNAGIYSGNGAGGPPTINVDSVYTPQMMRQAVNQGLSQNASGYASALNSMRNAIGGAGFSASSPLYQALSAQLTGQRIGSDANLRATIPMQLAQANTDQLFNAQQARSNQWQQIQQNLLQQQANASQLLGSMLSSVLGIARV